MLRVIYHYVERIGELSLPPIFLYSIYDNEKYDPGKPFNIHIQLLIIIIQEKNRLITTKKGKVKLPFFCGNLERINPIYVWKDETIKESDQFW